MSEEKVKFHDKRGAEKPEKTKFHVYPKCKTCKHFDNFIMANGQASQAMICVIDPPQTHAQIRGEDENGQIIFGHWHGWPFVNEFQRCSRHSDRDSN